MPESSLKTTRRGKRCSLRRYELAFIPMPDVAHADRPCAFAYVDSDLSYELANVVRSGCFTALVFNPRAQRLVIVAIIDHAQAALTARKAQTGKEDAEWEAQATQTCLPGRALLIVSPDQLPPSPFGLGGENDRRDEWDCWSIVPAGADN